MRRTQPGSYVPVLGILILSACASGESPTDPPPEEEAPPTAAELHVQVESGCEPLADLEVRLYAGEAVSPLVSENTDAAGSVTFDSLDQGTYAVEMDPPDGHGLVALEVSRKSTHLSEGTRDSMAFVLVPDPQPPVTDHEGTTYQTVKIGDQVWMAENLRVTTFANGEEIPELVSQGEWQVAADEELPGWAYYDNDAEMGEAYGPLYNNHVVMDPRGVCPAGWHVPDERDWQELELELGISEGELERIGLAGTLVDAGAVLKSTRTDPMPHPRWRAPNPDAKNCTGFSAVPNGYRVGHPKTSGQITGQFHQVGREAAIWSATASRDGDGNFGHGPLWGNSGVYRNTADGFGFSVRCVKDG